MATVQYPRPAPAMKVAITPLDITIVLNALNYDDEQLAMLPLRVQLHVKRVKHSRDIGALLAP